MLCDSERRREAVWRIRKYVDLGVDEKEGGPKEKLFVVELELDFPEAAVCLDRSL
jgi:hypothetical protein